MSDATPDDIAGLRAEIKRLRETNRRFHRRLQEAEAPHRSSEDIWKISRGYLELKRKKARADIATLSARIEALGGENARLRKALEFYRGAWSFTQSKAWIGLEWHPKEALLDDCGNLARAALAGEER